MLAYQIARNCCVGMDTKIVAEKCLLTQFYEKIEAAGSQGMTQQVCDLNAAVVVIIHPVHLV